MITYIIDSETTANGGPDGDSPEAHWLNNRVLHFGWRASDWSPKIVKCGMDEFVLDLCAQHVKGKHITIVGHNLKFDLKYLLREYPDVPWHDFDYVCTMHLAYRLSGHYHKFMSLENACKEWGVPFSKGLDLPSLIAGGIKMEDIPDSDLIPYLKGDVIATESLYANMHKFYDVRACDVLSNHALPLAAMELSGLKIDLDRTRKLMAIAVDQETKIERHLANRITQCLMWDDGALVSADDINMTAPRTISYLLTGEPRAGIGTGKKKIVFAAGFDPILSQQDIAKHWPNVTPTHLGYPLPANKLEELKHIKLVELVLKWRANHKLMSTYYGPFLNNAAIQGTIHPKMHMTSTNTGRGSSASPNGQNLPEIARSCCVSEFGEFHNVDFSQLEIYALAMLSQDKRLIADLASGVDIHFETGKSVMGWKAPSDMTEQTRRAVKGVNFGLIYGGGATTLANTVGVERALVKKLINAFYSRYPRVEKWQEDFYTEVTNNMQPDGFEDGEQLYSSTVLLPISNRLFHFKEKKSPKWLRIQTGRKYSFKPTETKNYPVQGFAGGDITMDALVLFYQAIKRAGHTDAAIRMTVHDSLLVDTRLGKRFVSNIMDNICQELKDKYNMPFTLQYDIKSGTHWR